MFVIFGPRNLLKRRRLLSMRWWYVLWRVCVCVWLVIVLPFFFEFDGGLTECHWFQIQRLMNFFRFQCVFLSRAYWVSDIWKVCFGVGSPGFRVQWMCHSQILFVWNVLWIPWLLLIVSATIGSNLAYTCWIDKAIGMVICWWLRG